MSELTYRDAIRETLREALSDDDRVFLMGEDIGAYGGAYGVTRGLMEEFGEHRVKDSPIAEEVLVGAGIGSAMGGLRPVVELMTINFSLLASDQIVNIAAKLLYMSGGQLSVPLIIRTVTGGGSQLAATHSQNLEGWYAQVPGLKVVAPATPYDARGLLRTAFEDLNPVIFVEHSLLYGSKGEVPDEPYSVPFGSADIKRRGADVSIIAYLRMVPVALEAAEELAKEGIEAEVIDLRSLRPLDRDTILDSVRKTNRAVVVEEGWRTGGFGAEIASSIMEGAFDDLDAPVARVAGEEVPMPYNRNLERAAIPGPRNVIDAVKSLL
jgi:pyruvate dehydrogenase E1 component beta subunit